MHLNAKLLFEKHAKKFFSAGSRVLELGPDDFPSTFQRIVPSKEWHTIDLYSNPKLTYLASDPYRFPVEDNSYDIVLSGQVFEHVKKPWKLIVELARICRQGGVIITVAPVSWPYHEAPVDCWRIYPEAMKALHEEARLVTELAVWESLELPKAKRKTPGRSFDALGPKLDFALRILRLVGFPSECSFDTIAVGRKAA